MCIDKKNDDLEKIKKVLLKRNMKVFEENKNEIFVFWEEKGKSKFGAIRRDYLHRYGVGTLISLLNGSKNRGFYQMNIH